MTPKGIPPLSNIFKDITSLIHAHEPKTFPKCAIKTHLESSCKLLEWAILKSHKITYL